MVSSIIILEILKYISSHNPTIPIISILIKLIFYRYNFIIYDFFIRLKMDFTVQTLMTSPLCFAVMIVMILRPRSHYFLYIRFYLTIYFSFTCAQVEVEVEVFYKCTVMLKILKGYV